MANPKVTQNDIDNAALLHAWAEKTRAAALAVKAACDAWSDVTGKACYAEIEGDSVTLKSVAPSQPTTSSRRTNGTAAGAEH